MSIARTAASWSRCSMSADNTIVTAADGARLGAIRSMLSVWLQSLPDDDYVDRDDASPLQVALRAISEDLYNVGAVEGAAIIMACGLVNVAERALWKLCGDDESAMFKTDLEATIGEVRRLLASVQVQAPCEASPPPSVTEATTTNPRPNGCRSGLEAGYVVSSDGAPPAEHSASSEGELTADVDEEPPRRALFQRFRWVNENDAQRHDLHPVCVADFIAGTRDATQGAAVIARIIEADRLKGELGDEPAVLDAQATSDLANFAAWALESLVDRADRLIGQINGCSNRLPPAT